MITDSQVRKLMELIPKERSFAAAAAKAGMDEKTARKYRDLGRLPSEVKGDRAWRTRENPFAKDWEEIRNLLKDNPKLEAKTVFDNLQRQNPGQFSDGQLRTLQRHVKAWRALEGPGKEVFFCQEHRPGVLCQSDFTHMTDLGVTIEKVPFCHLVYHFVLTYSNWEHVTVCFSESFESLTAGLQNALWDLGGVPQAHQSDRMSAAVHRMDHPEEFTAEYRALLSHYGLAGKKIQTGRANENGDVEQRHNRFKKAVDQALLLRGSRDFPSREAYEKFLRDLRLQLNAGRRERLDEELKVLRRLPLTRLDAFRRMKVKVGPGSTISVQRNIYSVHSRLIGEEVEVRIHAEEIEVWYAQRRVHTLGRLRGVSRHRIDFRHIIDWLVRKPGAFANYRYREDLFPSSVFRMAYDALRKQFAPQADKEYLKILELAAKENETLVTNILRLFLDTEQPLSAKAVEDFVRYENQPDYVGQIDIAPVDLDAYDRLFVEEEAA